MLSQELLGGAKPPEGMRDFYFLRHGQTHLNTICVIEDDVKKWGVQGGGTNSALNETGIEQARTAQIVVRALKKEKIVCSSLGRAIQTAVLIDPDCPIEFVDDIKERDYGEHEGKLLPREAFEGDYPGCELFKLFSNRVAKGAEHLRTPGMLMVAHRGVLDVMATLLNVELKEEHVQNARVLHFKTDGSKWTVDSLHAGNAAPLKAASDE